MHIVLIVLEVIGGLAGLAVILVAIGGLVAYLLTKDGSNPFQ